MCVSKHLKNNRKEGMNDAHSLRVQGKSFIKDLTHRRFDKTVLSLQLLIAFNSELPSILKTHCSERALSRRAYITVPLQQRGQVGIDLNFKVAIDLLRLCLLLRLLHPRSFVRNYWYVGSLAESIKTFQF
ncbi:hypothetical protein TNCT_4101 [Trichonephila clavata]|uniref:Uncharacterized protein n=1 Tax=Trichonephila clavata TaxID=2740835 RepID=A0A8X6FQM7_TRICU|nr:hypothetical protein TNCT_4101 [Trichonephila clavata]